MALEPRRTPSLAQAWRSTPVPPGTSNGQPSNGGSTASEKSVQSFKSVKMLFWAEGGHGSRCSPLTRRSSAVDRISELGSVSPGSTEWRCREAFSGDESCPKEPPLLSVSQNVCLRPVAWALTPLTFSNGAFSLVLSLVSSVVSLGDVNL
eukprot:CAMPEP_0174363626 /NCGR_PEP_ID=MMETSP0811_2-20130205/69571_1 /TAXON_ID=73025 ORGANISM="Eutreptiella gymnastica-like, Strain CCMP1594" /NCGR_SAMPLE_ID=MMETSP0811_2 /ASSEMBLY_ACC=CAM_ASM_000667 /LENGTH=149 /DNA_ID=CAMNT_0015502479 /DNA_START=57 /DNA_END=506 /DNA_ORIENTATION=+